MTLGSCGHPKRQAPRGFLKFQLPAGFKAANFLELGG
jgi:hypothetical protein